MTCATILLLLCVLVAVGTCLPSCCLATKGGIHFTEPMPSNSRTDAHTNTQTEGFMKHAIDMGSGATIYIPSFIKIGSGIQKFIAGIHRHTREHGDLISLL
jgi:hypothetical protein